MQYYKFDPETKEYKGIRIPQIDPRETKLAGSPVYMRPGSNHTEIAPPPLTDKQAAVWNGTSWDVVPDHRGELRWDGSQQQVLIKTLGDPEITHPHLKAVRPTPVEDQPLTSNIKQEAGRRIADIVGTDGVYDAMAKQLNALMQAVSITDKRSRGVALTPEEDAVAQSLRDMAAAIDVIRAKSNEIEAMDPRPDDFKDDKYWA